MDDNNPNRNINIGQGAEGVIGYNVIGNTIIQEQKLLITPEAIELNPFKARSPYKALKRFDVDDVEYFFGRYQLTLELHAAIQANNLILVLGASGSGKSSVVRAKLIPEFLGTSSNRHNFILTPREDPFQSLYDSLIGRDKFGTDKDYYFSESKAEFILEEKQNGKSDVFTQVISQLKDEGSEWLIFIDQFEELFTRCTNRKQRKNFIESITQIAESKDHSVKIVLAMRSDFLEQFSPYPRFGKIVQRQIHLVTDMPEDELELAIKGPAAKHGVRLQPGLAKEIIQDVQRQAGYLPLMQYTLDRLWKYEVEKDGLADKMLNTQNYRNLGKVRGALEKHANEIYDKICKELGEPGRQSAKQIFLKLVKVVKIDGVDKRVSQSFSPSKISNEAEKKTIARLIDENLLVSNMNLSQALLQTKANKKRSQSATIEIAHEIILSSWTILKGWIDEAEDILLIKSRLLEDMGRWIEHKKANNELLKGSILEKVLELKKDNLFELQSIPLSSEEETYIDASQRFQKQELNRARRVAVGASIGAALMTIAAIFAAIQVRRAEIQQIRTSIALSETNIALNQNFDAQIEVIRFAKKLQSSLFQKVFPDNELRNEVITGLQKIAYHFGERNRIPIRTDMTAISNDDKLLAVVQTDGSVLLWDITLGQKVGHVQGFDWEVSKITFSPDDNLLAIGRTDNGVLGLWNITDEELVKLKGLEGKVSRIFFSDNSKLIAARGNNSDVKVWETTGSLIKEFTDGRYYWDSDILLGKNGKYILDSKNNKLFNTEGKEIFPGEIFSDIKLSDDGQIVALCRTDEHLKVWNSLTGEELTLLEKCSSESYKFYFSTNKQLVMIDEESNKGKIWDISTNKIVSLNSNIDFSQGYRPIYFDLDSEKFIATKKGIESRSNMITLFDSMSQEIAEIAEIDANDYLDVEFSSDNKRIAICNDEYLQLWDSENRKHIDYLGSCDDEDDDIYYGFIGDGKLIFIETDYDSFRIRDSIDIFYAENGKKFLDGEFCSLKNFPNHNILAMEECDGTVVLWDVENEEEIFSEKLHQNADALLTLTLSPDGKYLASGGLDGSLKIWDLQEERELQKIYAYSGRIKKIFFNNDSQIVTTLGEEGNFDLLKSWDIKSTKNINSKNIFDSVNSYVGNSYVGNPIISFSGNSKLLAIGGRKYSYVRVWNTITSEIVHSFDLFEYYSGAGSVELNYDGQYLLTRQYLDSIDDLEYALYKKIWNTNTGKEAKIFRDNDGILHQIVFSPNNNKILTFEFNLDENDIKLKDHLLKLWDISSDKTINLEKELSNLGKELSLNFEDDEEWVFFDYSTIYFSPNSQYLLIGKRNSGMIRLWDILNKQEVKLPNDCLSINIDFSREIDKFTKKTIYDIKPLFSPDSSLLVFHDGQYKGIYIMNIANRNCKEIISKSENFIPGPIVFSSDSNILGVRDINNQSEESWRIFDLNGQEKLIEEKVKEISFSTNRELFATLPEKGHVKIWNTKLQQVAEIRKPTISNIILSPKGNFLASSLRDTVEIWNISTQKVIFSIKLNDNISKLVFSPDERKLAVLGRSTLQLLNLPETKLDVLLEDNCYWVQDYLSTLDKKNDDRKLCE